jgi:hypothetical protein
VFPNLSFFIAENITVTCTKVSALTPSISEYLEAIKMNLFSEKKVE